MSKHIRDRRRAYHHGDMRVLCHPDWRKIRKADKPALTLVARVMRRAAS